MYWDNIPEELRVNQQKVFQALNIPLEQYERTGQRHGDFLDEQLVMANEEDILVFVDIDCIPLNNEVIEKAIQFAHEGGIWGCAQVSNHLPDPNHVFAAPMFHAIMKRTWTNIGSPTYLESAENDVAQGVTRAAISHDVPVFLALPEYCLIPCFRFAKGYPYGIGTFYQGGVFHLFESRKAKYIEFFIRVATTIIEHREIDYMDLTNLA